MSGGGKGKQSGSSTTQVTYSPQEQAARDKIFAEGERLYNAALPNTTYLGPAPTPASPETQLAQNVGLATGVGAAGVIPSALGATNFALTDAPYASSNPYLQDAINAAIAPQAEAFTRTVMPSLRLGGMQTGTVGSSRQGVAEGLAAGEFARNIGRTATGMASEGYKTGLDFMGSTLRNLPSVMSGISSPASMISGVGAQKENIAAEEEAYQALQREQYLNGPWQLLQARAGLLNSMANPVTTSTQSMPRQGITPLQGVGGLLSLAPLIGKSKRHLKEAVVHLGDMDGVPTYQFRYRGEAGTWIGAMWDEVPAEARLGEFVNYAKVPVPFRQLEA